jgi:enoyl-CoA hydratase/carnithine racemase
MFVAAEKVSAMHALRMGLVDAIADDPVAEAVRRIGDRWQRVYEAGHPD